MKLRCRKCGNESDFAADCWERSLWQLDGNGEPVENCQCTASDFKVVKSTIVCEKCGAKVRPNKGDNNVSDS